MANAVESTTRPVIKEGSRGQDVKHLQTVLNLEVDGVFGPKTKEAVIAFQKQQNLGPDGIVGPNTWARLDTIETFEGEPANLPTLRRGDTGKNLEVRFLQERLNIRGVSVAVDGIFGPATEEAVKKFQTKSNLDVDGTVGLQTWTKLIIG